MERVVIGRVTVRSDARSVAAVGAPALRLRVERGLAAAGLLPPGLLPSAILVIRRLGSTPHSTRRSRQPGSALAALQREVEELHRAAVRPARGAAAGDAASVLFEDEAELLACLARDALAGQLGQRWYWRQFTGQAPATPAAALASAWQAGAAALPRAFAQLRFEEAARAVAMLDPAQVTAVVRSLEQAYALPGSPFIADRIIADDMPTAPPWRPWLPADESEMLAPAAERLLGTSLALAHAPAYARSPVFAVRAASWLRQAPNARRVIDAAHGGTPVAPPGKPSLQVVPPTGNSMPAAGASGAPVGVTSMQPPGPFSLTGSGATRAVLRAGSGTASLAAPAESGKRSEITQARPSASTPAETAWPVDRRPGTPAVEMEPVPAGVEAEAAGPWTTAGTPAVEMEPVPAGVEAEATEPWTAAGTATELGGSLFLLNLLAYLDLPHGWAGSERRDEELSGWALAEALARGLLGPDHDRYAQDPMWRVLAALDERAAGQPLRTGLGGGDFRLPSAWLRKANGKVTLRWTAFAACGRLLILDGSCGCLVVDAAYEGEPAAAAAAEAARYSESGLGIEWAFDAQRDKRPALPRLARSAIQVLDRPTAAWLRRVLPYVRHLLVRAMDLPAGAERSSGAALIVRPARVQVTNTHVDLFMAMESVSLPVRRAGLDADPGWVPDVGRIVLFHYGRAAG